MNFVLLVVLSGSFAAAYGQCNGSAMGIGYNTGIISSPTFIKKQQQSCNWIFEFNQLKPQMLILNLTDVQLYYLVWNTTSWDNIKTCGASLKIGEDNLDCEKATPKCYAFFNKHNDCLRKGLDSEYDGCSTLIESGNISITFIYNGSYGMFYDLTSMESNVENHPRGFHMMSKVLNCKEETTATTESTTRQDTSPVTTTPVSTIDLNTTTDKTTSDSATLSLTSDVLSTDSSSRDGSATPENDKTTSDSATLSSTSDILFTDFSSPDGNATAENNKDNPSWTFGGTITIIVVCSVCLLLLITVTIAVFFVRKRKQAQIPATTPDVTYENVGAPRQNLQSEIGVVGASGQNLQSEIGVVGAPRQNLQSEIGVVGASGQNLQSTPVVVSYENIVPEQNDQKDSDGYMIFSQNNETNQKEQSEIDGYMVPLRTIEVDSVYEN